MPVSPGRRRGVASSPERSAWEVEVRRDGSSPSWSQLRERAVAPVVEPAPVVEESRGGRGKVVMIRVSEQERAQLHASARAAGYGKTATWARGVLLGQIGAQARGRSSRGEEFEPFRRELARIGSNLNQVARALNTAAKQEQGVTWKAEAELSRLTREVVRLRAALEKATQGR